MEPEPFCVRGVVKDGQVILTAALPLPDGATVYVATEPPDQMPGPAGPVSPQARKQTLLAAARRLDLMTDPDWEDKLMRSLREPASPRAGAA